MTRISMCYEYTCHILFKEKMIKITFVVPIPPPLPSPIKKKENTDNMLSDIFLFLSPITCHTTIGKK